MYFSKSLWIKTKIKNKEFELRALHHARPKVQGTATASLISRHTLLNIVRGYYAAVRFDICYCTTISSSTVLRLSTFTNSQHRYKLNDIIQIININIRITVYSQVLFNLNKLSSLVGFTIEARKGAVRVGGCVGRGLVYVCVLHMYHISLGICLLIQRIFFLKKGNTVTYLVGLRDLFFYYFCVWNKISVSTNFMCNLQIKTIFLMLLL